MEKNCNDKYLNIEKKIDLPNGNMSIRNRFTYYPLYDVDKNSYIRRYRLWVKYRDKCIKEGRPFVSCKDYGKILNSMGEKIKEVLMTDPDGVSFKSFSLKTVIRERYKPSIEIKSKLKKKITFSIKDWKIMPSRLVSDKLRKLYKNNKLHSFVKRKQMRKSRTIADKLDIFDDF